jgi:glyoxylase-like metal-dependent hydrolase (beta-lactamase superfamily II)
MIIERTMSEGFLTNNYVVADEPGGHAVMIDAGGPVAPLLTFLTDNDLTLTHVLLTPGHTAGMLSLLVDGTDVFTGDTLFKGSVGGVRAPGSTSYADLKSSVMDTLLTLPRETRVHPGHTEPTTVGDELESNRFVRIWRGEDPEGTASCTALDEPATLILLGDDYDGGHKAWVRWPDGSDDIVPGSRVQPEA